MAGTADLFSTLTQPHSSMSYNAMVARKLTGTFARLLFNLRSAGDLSFPCRSTPREPGKSNQAQEGQPMQQWWRARWWFFWRQHQKPRILNPHSEASKPGLGSPVLLQRRLWLPRQASWKCGSRSYSYQLSLESFLCSLNDPMNYDNLVSPFCFTRL